MTLSVLECLVKCGIMVLWNFWKTGIYIHLPGISFLPFKINTKIMAAWIVLYSFFILGLMLRFLVFSLLDPFSINFSIINKRSSKWAFFVLDKATSMPIYLLKCIICWSAWWWFLVSLYVKYWTAKELEIWK